MVYRFKLDEEIKTAFVNVLKKAFRSNLEYPYIENIDSTEITILESWGTDYIKYPVISVECGDVNDRYRKTFGDFKEEITIDVSINGITYSQVNALRLGGTFIPSVIITIACKSIIQRDQISDWITLYLRHIFTNDLASQGITITGISKSGSSEVVIGNVPVFATNIICDLLVDWEEEVVVEPIETISGICQITIIETMMDGSTFSSS